MGRNCLPYAPLPATPRLEVSTWLSVFARGRIAVELVLTMEFLRTRPFAIPVVLSLRALRGLDDGVVVEWSFCWCRNSRSLRAKHRVQDGHSKGFSFVCDRSCRFKCSRRANDLMQVVQTCGLGLSVLGGGNVEAGGAAELLVAGL